MPDLLRRVAALTVLSAMGIALLAPLTARSAQPQVAADVEPLLVGLSAPVVSVERGGLADRTTPSRLSLAAATIAPATLEVLATGSLPTPAAAPMKATLHTVATPPPTPAPVVTRAPAAAPLLTGNTITGRATWYCCSLGYRGQAVVALPGAFGGRYDPPPAARTVTVCADRCVVLPVVDYCGCHWGTSAQRVADLTPEAWALITDRSRSAGVITVTLHLGS